MWRVLRVSVPRPEPDSFGGLEVILNSKLHEIPVLRRRNEPKSSLRVLTIAVAKIPFGYAEVAGESQVVTERIEFRGESPNRVCGFCGEKTRDELVNACGLMLTNLSVEVQHRIAMVRNR
jgi:hypothetical protein